MKNSILLDYLIEFPNFLSLFIFSFFMMFTSPILLDISYFFNVTPGNMNLIITFFSIGVAIGLVTSVFYNRKFKKIHIVLAAYLLVIPILIGLGLTRDLVVFNILYFFSGYLLGLIWINANSYMLEGKIKNKDSIVNLGYGFFAIGALSAPFLATGLLNRQMSWNIIYFIIIILVILAIFLYFITNKRRGKVSSSEQEYIPLKKIFKYKNKNIYFLFSTIIILFYVTSEAIIFSWAPSFFRIEKMFNLSSAGLILTIFWIGILIGRLSISFLSYRVMSGHILIGSAIISIIALIFTIFADNITVNFIAIGFAGLGFSGFVPLLISASSTIYDSGKDIVVTVLFLLGLSGNAIAPYLTKLVSGRSMVLSLALTVIFMSVVLVLTIIQVLYKRKFIK